MPPHIPPADTSTVWEKRTDIAAPEETKFLEGPQPRGFELARAARVFWELIRGFRVLHFVGPCVTVFGSARFKEGHPFYELGRGVARAGCRVMTGGGPGVTPPRRAAARSACPTGRSRG